MGFFSNPVKSIQGTLKNPGKAISNVVSDVGKTVNVDAQKVIKQIFGGGGGGGGWNPLGDIGNLVKDTAGNVGNLVKDTAGNVGKTATAILSDPKQVALIALSVAAPGAGTAIGEAIGLSGTAAAVAGSTVINTVANGGNVNDALKAAVIGTGVSNMMSGTNAAVTEATGSKAAGAAATGAVSSAVQGKDPLAGAINAGINSGVNTLANNAATAINTPTPNADNLNISPLSSTAPAPAPAPDIASIISSSPVVQASTSPVDAAASQSAAPATSPIDTSFSPNYSLLSTATPKMGVDATTGTGLSVTPFTSTETTAGVSPVDYSLYNPVDASGGLGVQLPSSPGIKAMGGAQGLTSNVTNPVTGETGVVGSLGYTPTGAAPVLGSPSSFINNPDVTGSPIMATDPAYYDVNLPRISVAGIGTSGSTSGAQKKATTEASPKSTYSTPLDAAAALDSYLNTTGATEAAGLAQLKQLFPGLTPDMAKILMERVGLTPSMLENSNFMNSDAQFAGSPDLSATALANIGQPDEFIQYARGGNVSAEHKPEFITGQTGHYAQGRGTGQSDDIPAVLHDGDYVIDADTVAALGDGSSKAGAGALEQFRRSVPEHHSGGGQPIRAQIADGEFVLPAGFVTTLGHGSNKQGAKMLDAMREQIRAHKRSAPDTKIPPKARSPLQYMREAMKG
jgi:hypothetical protein